MNMRIGELAKLAGCPPETVRFYEQKGLLPAPVRSDGNYRLYDVRHAERLHFIRRCRAMSMSLDEVQTLLDFNDHPERPCGGVNDLVDLHIGQIAQQINELNILHAELSQLRSRCNVSQPAGHCRILQQLGEHGEPRGSA